MYTKDDINFLQSTFIDQLKDKRFYQRDAALEYAAMIAIGRDDFNWKVINRAIIDRWSSSGLKRVKTMAHKMLPYVKQDLGV